MKMTSVDVDASQVDDLEDGEIESDSEQQTDQNNEKESKRTETLPEIKAEPISNIISTVKKNKDKETENIKSVNKKTEKKKTKDKEHSRKTEKERRPHVEKPRERSPSPTEDDFARNIEKAIKKELKKGGDLSVDSGIIENYENTNEDSEKKKHKKRKKHEYPEKERSSKRRKHDSNADDDEVDEDELMCVRGASPVHKHKKSKHQNIHRSDDDNDSYNSDNSDSYNRDRFHNRTGYRNNRMGGRDFRDRIRNRFDRGRYDKHSIQDPDSVCTYYMQGKCYKGDDCIFSHDARPPRKMELCKFYLMDCCAKRDKCLYLHSDFPCKYYHTGFPCTQKEDCKFAHGKPLSENFKQILIKHIESAPKEILGDFPRLNRDAALLMITNTQKRLQKEFPDSSTNASSPQNSSDEMSYNKSTSDLPNSNDSHKNKKNKTRQSRWCEPTPNHLAQNILSVQNLCGVLTSEQISDLISMGIENIHQLTNLTVQQLNHLGMTANQINEIQLNCMNIQKLGLIENSPPAQNTLLNKVKSKDLDMRVSPGLQDISSNVSSIKDSDLLGQDVDMRFLSKNNPEDKIKSNNSKRDSTDPRKQRNSIDIDQYTKDALKFSISENNECSDTIMSPVENNEVFNDVKKDGDVDHRLLKYVQDATVANVRLDDNAITSNEDSDLAASSNHHQHLTRVQKNEEKARRPTTDDEDDNLQIDEKWYSSDEDNPEKSSNKIRSPNPSDQDANTSAVSPQAIGPNIVNQSLGDLSKIDISDEVTKLLMSMKQSSDNTSVVTKKETPKSRDPRSAAKINENRDSDTKKSTSKSEHVSIYNCSENSDPDARRRTDVDLRPTKDIDFRVAAFGDTDLRQTPGGADIDLRLGLHFKAIPNYTPATEIDGSIGSHPPITYKVVLIDIPKPDYTDIKNGTPKSQASSDPRLRKIFRLSFDDSPVEPPPEKSSRSTSVRIDPRKRSTETSDKQIPVKPPPLDLQTVTQTSDWYKDLSTNHKIQVNQQLASVTSSLKKFHQDNTPGKFFDLTEIKSNNILCSILGSLGIFINEKGEFYRLNTQDLISSQSMNLIANSDMFMMDNLNMLGMNSMPNINLGNMGNSMTNYNSRFPMSDPRMQSATPQSYDNYGAGSNFNSESYSSYDNAMYNGPLNTDADYVDDNYDDTYYSDQNNDYRSNYRRSNDGWNRGRSRGGRDRRGYTERSHWNNDRN